MGATSSVINRNNTDNDIIHTIATLNGDGIVIGYLSDVEGDFSYWNRCVQHSRVLYRTSAAEGSRLQLRDDRCHFVYGGDVVDRGPGDLRVLQDLVNLKERYPDRVTLIMGNRDVNKLRILPALHEDVIKHLPRAYWLRTEEQRAVDPADFKLGDAESKMKWMLSRTMGAPNAYNFRRIELELLNSSQSESCVDEDSKELSSSATAELPQLLRVADSFAAMVQPKSGLMARYLQLAQISAVVGNVLFVHGAVRPHNLGWVPPRWSAASNSADSGAPEIATAAAVGVGYCISNPLEWSRLINEFAASEMSDYQSRIDKYLQLISSIAAKVADGNKDITTAVAAEEIRSMVWDTSGGYNHPQPGSRLLQYGMGRWADGTVNPSVIYASYLDNGSPLLSPSVAAVATQQQTAAEIKIEQDADAVAAWLKRGGINTVVVGHQPNGETPFILRDAAHGIQIVCADSSYSRNVQWQARDLVAQYAIYTSKDTAAVAAVTDNETADSNWLTFEEFLQQRGGEEEIIKELPEKHNTRSSLSISEVVIALGGSGVEQQRLVTRDSSGAVAMVVDKQEDVRVVEGVAAASNASGGELINKSSNTSNSSTNINNNSINCPIDSSSIARLAVHGVLSNGAAYQFAIDLNAIPKHSFSAGQSQNISSASNDERSDDFIGRMTASGWVVKASGVRIPLKAPAQQPPLQKDPSQAPSIDSSSISSSDNDSDVRYYLLSHSQGHTFRNRLVRSDRILEEFSSSHDVDS